MESRKRRPIAVIGAASSIGIRPYDDRAEPRQLDRAPATLRELGLLARLDAEDLGDLAPPAYRDFTRPPKRARNERELVEYSRVLAERVADALGRQRFALVLGGDCSIVLGSLLGAGRHASRLALAYVDAHADFATPEESATGSAASMCLAMAVGRGDTPLAALAGPRPLVRGEDVVLIGRRDQAEPYYGQIALGEAGVMDIPGELVAADGPAAAAAAALERLGQAGVQGFWIHVDADVLDAAVMPAVDSPEPGGPTVDELARLVSPLVRHPGALGMQVTIYDPGLDPDRSCGARLVTLLEKVLVNGLAPTGR